MPTSSNTSGPIVARRSFPNILSFPSAPKVLDPYGIDVEGEIPHMQAAYAQTNYGRNFGGKQEAGYAIFGQGYHTGVNLAPEAHLSIPTPPNSLAIVHTHPTWGDPRPSSSDINNAQTSKIPNYVYSTRNGKRLLYVVNPKGQVFQYDIDNWNTPNAFSGTPAQ